MKSNKKMDITESEPIIKKIELVNKGMDGLEVTYKTMITRNGVGSVRETTDTEHRPVQKELRKLFVDLNRHLLKTTGVYWNSDTALELLLNNTESTYLVTDGEDKFMLVGKRKVMGDYVIPAKSALINNEDYDEYYELEKIIDKIKREANLFMIGAKGADSRTVVIDYMISKKNYVGDVDGEFERMSKEEQAKFMKDAFKEYGLEMIEENGETVVSVVDDKQPITIIEDVMVAEKTIELVLDKDLNQQNPLINFEE